MRCWCSSPGPMRCGALRETDIYLFGVTCHVSRHRSWHHFSLSCLQSLSLQIISRLIAYNFTPKVLLELNICAFQCNACHQAECHDFSQIITDHSRCVTCVSPLSQRISNIKCQIYSNISNIKCKTYENCDLSCRYIFWWTIRIRNWYNCSVPN